MQLLQRGLNIETLLMVTADTKPKVLHLKPEHYVLLSTQDIPLISSKKDFSSVECVVVHGRSDLSKPVDKERLNTIFPNLQTHTFLEGEYYECYEPKSSVPQDQQKHVNFERRDSNVSSTSSSSVSSNKSSSNDDYLSVNSSD